VGLLVECPNCKTRNSPRKELCRKCGLNLKKTPHKVYWIEYYDHEKRRRRERVGPNKRAAELRLAEVKRELAEGRVIRPLRQNLISFSDFWETLYWPWTRTLNRPGWLRRKEIIYRLYLKPEFGNSPVSAITRVSVESFRQKRLQQGASPAEVNREIAVLRHALNYAVNLELLSSNPASRLGALKEKGEDAWQVLSKEEAARFLNALPDDVRPIFEFALATGLRMGNILNLRWKQVDLKQRRLTIPGAETKSGKPLILPLSDWAVRTLQKQKRSSEYVFPNPGGKPYSDLRKSFHKALEKAGLPRIRMHDLRHTFASWAIQAGVDFRILKELLGHSTLDMALRYTHLDHQHLLLQVNRIKPPTTDK